MVFLSILGLLLLHTSLAPPASAHAQTKDPPQFSFALLSHLYEHFELEQRKPLAKEDMASGAVAFYQIATAGTLPKVKVEYDADHVVEHIGFDFFAENDKKAIRPFGDFIERFFLYLYAESESKRNMLLEANHVLLTFNGIAHGNLGSRPLIEMIRTLSDISGYSQSNENGHLFFSCKDSNDNELTLLLPARIDLISGRDKKELEDRMHEALRASGAGLSRQHPLPREEMIPYRDNLFQTRGDSIYTGLSSALYFRRENDDYALVNDPDYPLESLANVLLHPSDTPTVTLSLTHQTYTMPDDPFSIDLAALIERLSENHEGYVGFEIAEDGSLQSTQIFEDRTYTSLHMLTIIWPSRLHWSSPDEQPQARLYTYIRNDNVQDLFGKYIERLDRTPLRIELNRK